MICAKCGAPIYQGQSYCSVCNTPVASQNSSAAPQPGYIVGNNYPPNVGRPQAQPYPNMAPPVQAFQQPNTMHPPQQHPSDNVPVPTTHSQQAPQVPQTSAPVQQVPVASSQSAQAQQVPAYAQQPVYSQPIGMGYPVQNSAWQQPSIYTQAPMMGYNMQPYSMPSYGYVAPTPPAKKWNPKKQKQVLETQAAKKAEQEMGFLTPMQCFITVLLGMLPIIGIFFCLAWSNSAQTNKMKANMAKGMLIIQGIFLAIVIIFLIVWIIGLVSAASTLII